MIERVSLSHPFVGVPMSCAHLKPDEKPAPLPCAISGTGEGSGEGRSEAGAHVFPKERARVRVPSCAMR
jgi:hypothetical protein